MRLQKKARNQLVVLLGLWMALEGQLWAFNESEVRRSIEATIDMRHPSETADWWRSLGPHAPRIIMEMVQAEKRTYQKIRLIDGLAWFDDPQVVEFLKQVVDTHPDTALAYSALRSLAISQGEKQRAFLEKGLQSQDPQTRAQSVRLLARINGKRPEISPYSLRQELTQSQEPRSPKIEDPSRRDLQSEDHSKVQAVPGRIQKRRDRMF